MISRCFSAACLFLLAACSMAERPAPEPGAPVPPPPPALAAAPPPIAVPAPAAPSPPAAPPAGMTLAEALRTALARNPDLAAIRGSEEVSRAALEVERSYPHNPQLAVDVRPLTRESNGQNGEVFVSASLLQEIELARQGRYRQLAGEAEVDRTQFQIQTLGAQVAAETSRRFFTALARRAQRELAEAEAALKETLLAIVERRFQAGLAVAADLALARVEARSARQQVDLARAREAVALQEVRKQIGLGGEEPLQPVGDVERWPWPAPEGTAAAPGLDDRAIVLERLIAIADLRPDLREAEADLRARSARADLASAARIPNIALGPVYEKDEAGTNFLGVETQVALPIFSTGGPLYRQRLAEARQGADSLAQLRTKARLEVRTAFLRYEESWRLADRFRRDLTEGFEPELQRMRDQFEAGLTTILEVYAAQANVQKGRSNLLDAQLELALAAVDFTAAAALPAEDLLIPKLSEGPPK